MEASYFLFNNSSDDTLDLLKEFLPEIEQELRLQIEPALLEEFAQLTTRELQKIQDQGELQYKEALETLENEFQQLKAEKAKELQSQLIEFQQKLSEHEKQKAIAAHEKFIQDNFDQRILNHQKMQEVYDEMENEIGEAMIEKYELMREKKTKELRIRLQSRQQRERVDVDKAIQTEIYSKSGLEQLKEEVKQFRISLASLKSKYNIKINSISKEIQDLNKKCIEKEYKDSDLLIQDLQREIEALESKQNENDSFGQEEMRWQEKREENTADNISKHKIFSLINQPFTNCPQNQYLHQDIDLDSEDSILSQSSRQQEESEHQIPMPPERSHLLTHLLSNDHESVNAPPAQIYLEMPRQPLLKFNIAKMLRDQWEQDDLDRYLYGSSQKQNKNLANLPLPSSNFSSLYKQHLEKLNRPKLRKLSDKAKQQFMFNLSSQSQKRQERVVNS